MKKLHSYLILLALSMFIFTLSVSAKDNEKDKLDDFNKNLMNALKSDNEGVKLSALERVIQYSDKVEIATPVVQDMVKMFRTHKDEKVRQLTLTAISKTGNDWAMDFLKRHVKYEKSQVLQKQIYAILAEYSNKKAE